MHPKLLLNERFLHSVHIGTMWLNEDVASTDSNILGTLGIEIPFVAELYLHCPLFFWLKHDINIQCTIYVSYE